MFRNFSARCSHERKEAMAPKPQGLQHIEEETVIKIILTIIIYWYHWHWGCNEVWRSQHQVQLQLYYLRTVFVCCSHVMALFGKLTSFLSSQVFLFLTIIINFTRSTRTKADLLKQLSHGMLKKTASGWPVITPAYVGRPIRDNL